MAAFDLKDKRLQAGVSQLQLSLRSRVSRWRLRLHEAGIIELRDDELRRVGIVLKHALRASRTSEAAQQRALNETLRELES